MGANDENDIVFNRIITTKPRDIGMSTDFIFKVDYLGESSILKVRYLPKTLINEASNFIKKYHPELEEQGIMILPKFTGDFDDRTFELLPLAPGKSLGTMIDQYMKKEIPASALEKYYFALGATISHIHSLLSDNIFSITNLKDLKTIVHTDLHGGNIFCNKGEITIIDNEDLSKTTHNVYDELTRLLNYGIDIDILFSNEKIDKAMMKEYIQLVETFFKGYISHNLEHIDCSEYLSSIY